MNSRYCNGMIYVVKKGDTLYGISRQFRVPLALILRANPYVDVYNLQVGTEICVPMGRPNPMPPMNNNNNCPCQNGNRPGPGAGRPMMDQPGTGRPMMDQPGTGRPMMDQPGTGRPMMEPGPARPMMDQPGTGRPMMEPGPARPMMDQPEMRRPMMDQPEMRRPMMDQRDEDEEDDMPQMEQQEEAKAQPYDVEVTDGNMTLGKLLKDNGLSWEEFKKINDLDQVLLAKDVVVYLPKKV